MFVFDYHLSLNFACNSACCDCLPIERKRIEPLIPLSSIPRPSSLAHHASLATHPSSLTDHRQSPMIFCLFFLAKEEIEDENGTTNPIILYPSPILLAHHLSCFARHPSITLHLSPTTAQHPLPAAYQPPSILLCPPATVHRSSSYCPSSIT